LFNKVYSARHKNLKGLEKAVINNVIEFGHFASLASFADPEVKDALLYLMRGGEEAAKWLKASGEIAELALSLETPLGVISGCTIAYDAFADMLRGYINVPMDLYTIPDKVQAACEVMDVYSQKAVDGAADMGLEYFFIPLHGGTDELMSDAMYRKYYWPYLYRMIEHIIARGMTPYILTEGNYDTRLEALSEVPKGKIIYMFEKVDIARAKKILGGTACICGNFPTTDLIYSTKEKITEDTKRMLDVCAPGGGFIMNCSIVLDNYKRELLDAWYEATLKYGVY
jgi:uroporphyrinogen-III decarboxylase